MADDSTFSRLARAFPAPGRGGLLLFAVTYAAAVASGNRVFTPNAVTALALLTGLVLVLLPGGPAPRWTVSVAAMFSAAILYLSRPTDNVTAMPLLTVGIVVGVVAALSVALAPWLPKWRLAVTAALAVTALSYVLIILGGAPVIDVWIILRDAANGLLAGLNPYEMTFPGVPAGQTDSCFNYLPATFLLTAPGQWLAGDVRWIESGGLFAACALLVWQASDGGRRLGDGVWAALLVGVLPGTLRVVQQSWNEPLLLLGLVAAAVLIARRRANWAVLPVALALATKQHVVLLLPLLALWPAFGWRRALAAALVAGLICLPWLVANPARFYGCTVAFFTDTPLLSRSVSLWQVFPEWLRLPALLVALVLVYGLALLRLPRTSGGLLVACGAIFMTFDLMNKQTFLNQWALAAELLIAGLALGTDGSAGPAANVEGHDG